MYENMIGCFYVFWEVYFDYLKEIFDKEFKNVILLEFY